jgi:lipoprotein NlpI
MRGELYERLGELSVAAHDFQQVLQINPTNEQAQWHLRQIAAYIQHQ